MNEIDISKWTLEERRDFVIRQIQRYDADSNRRVLHIAALLDMPEHQINHHFRSLATDVLMIEKVKLDQAERGIRLYQACLGPLPANVVRRIMRVTERRKSK